jgi:two-component system osmolarity sensor histidine kinase EnvZ
VKQLFRPETLLGRTALALAIAFVLFGLLSAALLQFTLVRPHTKQAADDLAAFLVLAAQIWVELPPYTRPDYEREMRLRHALRITQTQDAHSAQPSANSYLSYLETALSAHIGLAVRIHHRPEHEGWLWADFPMGGRMMRLGFRQSRLHDRGLLILPLLAAAGLFVAFALSILLVRRITRPLAIMAEATHRIGQGDFSSSIPETGPREIAELAVRLNEMEAQIGRLLENRTTLLAGISHDLRTPLARMRLELELLQGQENGELIEGLGNDITEMETLISQTLLLARGLGGEEAVEVEINALLQEIAGDFRAAGKPVECRPSGRCLITLRAKALKRVLINLVENAVSYSGQQPVTLECEGADDAIGLRVIDKGPGIPESEYDKIFQPFQRLENSRSRATGGSGLGLAIVQQLCRANGWEIALSPAPQGTGTVFEIRLPISPGAE